MTPRSIPHLPAIDGLRGVAILAVLAYHAGWSGSAGYVGVDIFFVISGYLITRLLREDGDLLAFYARRARRIVPAAVVVILATLAASSLLLSPARQADTANNAGAALVFAGNIYSQLTTGGYFDARAEEQPLLHLWSLGVEEQFYLLWPFLLMLRTRWIIAIALSSFAFACAVDPQIAFFQVPARAWELAAGGLVAMQAPRVRHAGAIGSVLLLVAIVLPLTPFPGIGALPAVAGAALVVSAVHRGQRIAWLESKPLVAIGLVSYSLYLWHWPLLALYRATTVQQTLGTTLALCVVALLLAIASYRYVEQPFRRMQSGRLQAVAVGGGVSVALALTACTFAMSVKPDMRFAAPDRHCHSQKSEAPVLKCTLGDTVVWGDSMAYAWTPAFPEATSATRDACAPFLDHPDVRCRQFNEQVLHAIPANATVVLVGFWQPGADLTDTFARLRGHRVIVIGPTPVMRKEVPACMAQGIEAQCAITRAEFDRQAKPIYAALRAQATAFANVEVRDPTAGFCTSEACPPVLDGVPLYWDTHHVTSAAVRAAWR